VAARRSCRHLDIQNSACGRPWSVERSSDFRNADWASARDQGSVERRTSSTWAESPSPGGGNRAHPSASRTTCRPPVISEAVGPASAPVIRGHRSWGTWAFGNDCGRRTPGPWRRRIPMRGSSGGAARDAGRECRIAGLSTSAGRSDGCVICARGARSGKSAHRVLSTGEREETKGKRSGRAKRTG